MFLSIVCSIYHFLDISDVGSLRLTANLFATLLHGNGKPYRLQYANLPADRLLPFMA